MEFTYDVFFSYRHRPLDGEITQKSFNAIESYRLPKAVKEQGFEDIRRAFRDTEELPVSRILTDTIDKALHSTNSLIVVCSTDTPVSEWIDREVSTFIELGRADHIYPLLINGDPEQSFPPSLKLVPDIADRVMDIRTGDGSVKKMMAKEETELLRVIAGITGCSETQLRREHKLRKARQTAARALGAAAVFVAIGAVSLGLMNLAQDYRNTARRREEASMQMLQDLTYGLPDKLTNIPGAYSRISDILRSNTEDINEIIRLSTDKEAAEFEVAANYEKLATAAGRLGNYDDALVSENTAIDVFSTLHGAGCPGGTEALASAYANRGIIYKTTGSYGNSSEDFSKAIELLESTGTADPATMARVYFNAGAGAADSGDSQYAAIMYEKSLKALENCEKTQETLETEALVLYNSGLLYYRTGRYSEAKAELENACSRYEELISVTDSRQNRGSYVDAASALAVCCTDMGDYERAEAVYDAAISCAEKLAEGSDSVSDITKLATLYNNFALSLNIRGDFEGADALYAEASGLYGQISAKTDSAADRAVYAVSLLNTGENAFKAGSYARSEELFREGLDEYGAVFSSLGSYDTAGYYAWLSYYELIHSRDYSAALEAAMNAYDCQPENVLVNLNLAYACMYSGNYADADWLFSAIAALGAGQAETIRLDIEAQQRAGMECEHAFYVLESLDGWST